MGEGWRERGGWRGRKWERFRPGLGGVTLTSLVCHINNRAFGGNVATVPGPMDKLHEGWRIPMGSSLPTLPPSRYFIENSILSGRDTGSNGEEGRVPCDSRVQVGEIGSCLFERFGNELHLFQGEVRYFCCIFYYESDFKYIYFYLREF